MLKRKAFSHDYLEVKVALLDYFLRKNDKKPATASKAKERLQIIVAHERRQRSQEPDYLPQLTEELLAVLRKYIHVSDQSLSINLDKKDGDLNVLELNIELLEEKTLTN